MRQQATARAEAPEATAKSRPEKRRASEADDYLDIPAFLRRQAD
jgi:cell division protein FtsZ